LPEPHVVLSGRGSKIRQSKDLKKENIAASFRKAVSFKLQAESQSFGFLAHG
jgi:hypothetical protein